MSAPVDPLALDQIFRKARTRNGWVDERLPESTWHELYQLVKLGPTSANSSPGRFVFVTSAEGKARIAPLLSENNRKALAAPCIVIIGYDLAFTDEVPKLFPHNPTAQFWFGEEDSAQRLDAAFRNSSLEGAYLILAARAMGLDCGPMSGFDVDGVTREFFAGTKIKANFLCALGHGADEPFPRLPRLAFDEAAKLA